MKTWNQWLSGKYLNFVNIFFLFTTSKLKESRSTEESIAVRIIVNYHHVWGAESEKQIVNFEFMNSHIKKIVHSRLTQRIKFEVIWTKLITLIMFKNAKWEIWTPPSCRKRLTKWRRLYLSPRVFNHVLKLCILFK